MKSEFQKLVHENKNRIYQAFTDSDYESIETVYMFHPSIDTKQRIADLFCNFGMTVIMDMFPRAEKLADLEERIHVRRTEIARLQKEIDSISKV